MSDEETISIDEALPDFEAITSRAFRSGDRFFVRSKSSPHRFYMIRDGICPCKGFQYNHTCNHTQHLVKEGYLRVDVTDMGYRHVLTGGFDNRPEELVTGQVRVENGATEHEQRLSAQIRRLQAAYRAQGKVVDAQRRLLYAIRADRSSMVQRTVRGVQIEEEALEQELRKLRPGDLVELDIS